MDYPSNTISKPVTGKQARRVIEALRSGKAIENAASRRTVRELLKERKQRKAIEHAEAD